MAESAGQPANPERLSPEELTRLQPGLARLMPEIANRLWRAVYAARAGNWRLARWQLSEMRKLFLLCAITRPKYGDDIGEYLHEEVELLLAAVQPRTSHRSSCGWVRRWTAPTNCIDGGRRASSSGSCRTRRRRTST